MEEGGDGIDEDFLLARELEPVDEVPVGVEGDALVLVLMEELEKVLGDVGNLVGKAEAADGGLGDEVGGFTGGYKGEDGFTGSEVGIDFAGDAPVVGAVFDAVEGEDEQVGLAGDVLGQVVGEGAELGDVGGEIQPAGPVIDLREFFADEDEADRAGEKGILLGGGGEGGQEKMRTHPFQMELFAEAGAEEKPPKGMVEGLEGALDG